MKNGVDEKDIIFKDFKTHKGAELIGEQQGAKNGFCYGISYYYTLEFTNHPGVHEDQEGFYVLEGIGEAKIGNKVFKVTPGKSFIVHAGVPHEIRRDVNNEYVKVLWIHCGDK